MSVLRTTESNLGKFTHVGTDWKNLSKTFQEAISVTRALGLDYIWIDSLCRYTPKVLLNSRYGSNLA